MKAFVEKGRFASIVLVGSFNPVIFHPQWFIRHGLVQETDINEKDTEIVHPDICKFSLGWAAFDILRNKFVSRTNDPSQYCALRDLTISAFSILSHTPLNQLGMNLTIEYSISSIENWHKIGDILAPKDPWRDLLPERIGMRKVIIQSSRKDALGGYIMVEVEPTNPSVYGVRFSMNSHVELVEDEENSSANYATIVLSENWETTLKDHETLSKSVLERILYG